MNIHVNELKLKGEDEFSNKFNHCSDLYAKATDETLDEETRDQAMKDFISARIRLEQGI